MSGIVERFLKWAVIALVSGFLCYGLWLLTLGQSLLTEDVEYNIAPFARYSFDGIERAINPDVELSRAHLDVIADGSTDTLYMAEFAVRSDGSTLQIDLPFPCTTSQVALLGDGKQEPGFLTISFQDAGGKWREYSGLDWVVTQGVPPNASVGSPMLISAIRYRFSGCDNVILNWSGIYVAMPRWRAWLIFAGLTIVIPFAAGLLGVFGVIFWGRLLFRREPDSEWSLVVRTLSGLAVLIASSLFFLFFASKASGWIVVGGFSLGAGLELFRLIRRTITTPLQWNEKLQWIMLAGLLIVSVNVMVDTNAVALRRVQPVDFLIPHAGAQRLSAGVMLNDEYASRPWLVHVMFAPFDATAGRMSYWVYCGFLSGLNVFVLVPIALYARRMNCGEGWEVAALVLLLPVHSIFHMVGQRPLAAALCLLAIWCLDSRAARRHLVVGGCALALAIMAHPGSVFILPGMAFYILWNGRGRKMSSLVSLFSVPMIVYAVWIAWIRWLYPEHRNALMYYPIMTTLTPFDSDMGLTAILKSLPKEHWLELVMNRVSHLRHYFWTDNMSLPVVDEFRWISIPNAVGFTLPLLAMVHRTWMKRVDWGLGLCGVMFPLLVHHLYIGQAHAQFHISPVPFYSLAIFLSVALGGQVCGEKTGRLSGILMIAVFVEIFIRNLFPLWIVIFLPESRGEASLRILGMFLTDEPSYRFLALLPTVVWTGVAWRLVKSMNHPPNQSG